MRALRLVGMAFAALLMVVGFMTANGITGNLVAGCDCISQACIQSCGPDGSVDCCTAQDGQLKQVPQMPTAVGYIFGFIGTAGFFVLLMVRAKERKRQRK